MSQDKIYSVVSRVLGVPVAQMTEETSPDTVQKWDSLSHVNLIIALESEFGVQLSPEEAMDMMSVKLIRMTLSEHGINAKRS